MAYFVAEPLLEKKKKGKYCKLVCEKYVCFFVFVLVCYHHSKMCWKVSHALLGTSAIRLPSLEKQHCNLGELHKTSGWEDMRWAGLWHFFLLSCTGSKSNISEVCFYRKIKEIWSLVKKQLNEDVIFAGNMFSVHLQGSLSWRPPKTFKHWKH